MNTADFEQILDNCLTRFSKGETIEQCLADFPDAADELRPFLRAASIFQAASYPAARPRAVEKGQAAMLNTLNQQSSQRAVSFAALPRYAERILSILKQEEASQMRLALRSVVTTVLLLFVTGFFALTISANSLPGEPFYPVKRGWESVRVGLTFDNDSRQLLEQLIQKNRQSELAALIELGRQTQIVYEGYVEHIEANELIVDGFVFQTTLNTKWLVTPEVGEAVQIETEITADGELIALKVEASPLASRPVIAPDPTVTPCNTPSCNSVTATPTPCNVGACGSPTATPTPFETPQDSTPTPTPCNTSVCGSATVTPTPCVPGKCGTSTPIPLPTQPPNGPTPTPCNSPACASPVPTSTPCNAGTCGSPSPTPPPTSTPCNSPSCAPPTSTPFPTHTPGDPTATPCNSPACSPPTPTPTPCTGAGCGGSTPTPGSSTVTPTPCNFGTCGGLPTMTPLPTFTPSNMPTATPCNTPGC